jgi:hypothetical protein
MKFKPATLHTLQKAVNTLATLYAELEGIEDPVFDEDDTSLTEIMASVKEAQDGCEELVNA